MRSFSILTILCLTILSCNSSSEKESEHTYNLKSTKQMFGKMFFDYNAIDYYTNDYEASKIEELFNYKCKNKLDSFMIGIILGDIPYNISDSGFVEILENIGYKKTQIEKSKFDSIDKIFIEKTTTDNIAYACVHVYRDILIFKKENKVIGTAKVCFSCKANQIKGTTANTDNFGQEGDYEKLKNILRQ